MSGYFPYCIMIASNANGDSFHARNPNFNRNANPTYIYVGDVGTSGLSLGRFPNTWAQGDITGRRT